MPSTPTVPLFDRAAIQVRSISDAAASSEAASLGGLGRRSRHLHPQTPAPKEAEARSRGGSMRASTGKINPARSNSERIVIPPDPAILLGYAKAGDIAHPAALSTVELHDKKHHGHSRSHSQSKSPSPPGGSRVVSESHMLLHPGTKSAKEEKVERPGHTRSGSSHSSRSTKQLPPVPTSPSRPVPLKTMSSPATHHHKKSHSHSSSSKSRPSSPRKATDIDDEMTVPLNPHET
ncbi:hypothetical protein NMY22_g18266 [Coprinellus aureogranulatus]|nr:hypothetical protein NMY22_g18266 [Coprinellus aureogranulatus]